LAFTHPEVPPSRSALPASAWARICAARTRLLILDYDGTLVPFRADRMSARAGEPLLSRLREVTERSTLRPVVLSGRPLAELRQLLGGSGLRLVGLHGWEEWTPGQEVVEHAPGAAVRERLEAAARAVAALGWQERLEVKRCALAFHTRGLPPAAARDREQRVGALWEPLGRDRGLRFDRTHGGLELRASERDKGTVVTGLQAGAPEGTLVAFVGDDATDEAAFAALGDQGLSIRVGADLLPTAAQYRLAGPDQVEAFLARWTSLLPARETAS